MGSGPGGSGAAIVPAADTQGMEIVGNVVFGLVAAVSTNALFAMPGFVLGGAVGLVVRHFTHPARRMVRYIVIGA